MYTYNTNVSKSCAHTEALPLAVYYIIQSNLICQNLAHTILLLIDGCHFKDKELPEIRV